MRGAHVYLFVFCRLWTCGGGFLIKSKTGIATSDFVYSAYGDQLARCVYLLVKRSLDAKVNLVHVVAVDGSSCFFVADIVVINSSFPVVAVFAPNDQTERVAFLPSVGAVPGGSFALSLNGGLKCRSGSKIGAGASGMPGDLNLVDLISEV